MARYFGTDGIRGPVATSPFLTPSFLHRFGIALNNWALTAIPSSPTIVFGCDTRASSKTIERALAAGITYAGGICVSAGVLPTPALQHLVSAPGSTYDYGIMISASHNKASDNGIKLLTRTGKLSPDDELIFSDFLSHTPELPSCNTPSLLEPLPSHHAISYMARMSTFFPSKLLRGMSVALDCAHGSTTAFAPTMFRACGATVHVMGNQPNGHNINQDCGSTAPDNLAAFVQHTGADLGFAFDGDGDRVVAVTANGTIKDGDQLLALLATHPRFASQAGVVGTVLSNLGLEHWLHERNQTLLRTSVGDTHVLRTLTNNNLSLGGEPSGHLILRNYMNGADGLFTALFAAHTAQITNNLTMQTFTPCPQVNINLPIKNKQDLTQEPYASILQAHHVAVSQGRSIVRYSGTESLLRIMVEHPCADQAHQHATRLATQLKPLLVR